MKKMLITWIMAAVSASPAYAQSSVRISGSIYGGAGLSWNATKRAAMAGPSSLMFSGKEDLGGGLSTLFKLESGFHADTGAQASTTAWFDKQAFVGLQGAWGTLRAGRVYTPAFGTLALVADPTGTNSLLTSTNLMESHGVRSDNGVIYNTPGFNPWTYARTGVYGVAAHFFGESPTGGASRDRATGLSLGYGKGPLVVELSHQSKHIYTPAKQDVDSRSTILAANYNFGVTRVHIAYSKNRGRNMATNVHTKDNTDFLLGLVIPARVGVVTVSHIRKSDRLPANNDAYMIGTTYDYPLSRRTRFTVGYALIHNRNPVGTYRVANGYTGTSAATGGTSAFTVGIAHQF